MSKSSTRLPKVLKREPLVDALFEMRLDGSVSLADILPGILFYTLEPKPKISRLPAAELPQPVRAEDPHLRYSPTQRLEWGKYVISVGDRNIVITCQLPYPGWAEFKGAILEITNKLTNVGVIGRVERFSVKYVDIIEGSTYADQLAKIDLEIRTGALEITDNHINMQIHHIEENIVHIQTFITGATVKLWNGKEIHGIVVDTDSIQNIDPPLDFADIMKEFESHLEKLKKSNKARFFECMKQKTIDDMEPIYE